MCSTCSSDGETISERGKGLRGKRVAVSEALVSRREAAQLLGVSVRTIDRLAAGELTRVKIGRRTLFDPLDIRRYIARCRRPGAGAEAAERRITDGQLRALHAKAYELDKRDGERPGTWKRSILMRASARLGREIESAHDLAVDEAIWILDELERELQGR